MAKKVAASKALALKNLARVILYVKDTVRSARWYQRVLGVPISHGEPGWAQLETKGVSLCLHGGRKRSAAREETHVAFRVEDFDAAYRALQLREVPALGRPHSPCGGLRCVSFEDPDGNSLGIEGR